MVCLNSDVDEEFLDVLKIEGDMRTNEDQLSRSIELVVDDWKDEDKTTRHELFEIRMLPCYSHYSSCQRILNGQHITKSLTNSHCFLGIGLFAHVTDVDAIHHLFQVGLCQACLLDALLIQCCA